MPNVKLTAETHAAIQELQGLIIRHGVNAAPKSVLQLLVTDGATLPMDKIVAAGVELLRQAVTKGG